MRKVCSVVGSMVVAFALSVGFAGVSLAADACISEK